MPNIINNDILRQELRRIIQEELQKELPKRDSNILWKWLQKLNDRIKVLEDMLIELKGGNKTNGN